MSHIQIRVTSVGILKSLHAEVTYIYIYVLNWQCNLLNDL